MLLYSVLNTWRQLKSPYWDLVERKIASSRYHIPWKMMYTVLPVSRGTPCWKHNVIFILYLWATFDRQMLQMYVLTWHLAAFSQINVELYLHSLYMHSHCSAWAQKSDAVFQILSHILHACHFAWRLVSLSIWWNICRGIIIYASCLAKGNWGKITSKREHVCDTWGYASNVSCAEHSVDPTSRNIWGSYNR
jgi:hypothetical protein